MLMQSMTGKTRQEDSNSPSPQFLNIIMLVFIYCFQETRFH